LAPRQSGAPGSSLLELRASTAGASVACKGVARATSSREQDHLTTTARSDSRLARHLRKSRFFAPEVQRFPCGSIEPEYSAFWGFVKQIDAVCPGLTHESSSRAR
jgi:hypothetical protein